MSNPFALINITVPVGAIIAFAGNVEKYTAGTESPPSATKRPIESFGWMLCDGSALNAFQYPELFAVLGTLYGSDGTGDQLTFNLPDLRGQFLRGVGTDQASNEDRTQAPNGSQNGVGSTQKDALQTHVHQYNELSGATPGNNGSALAIINQKALTGIPVNEESSPAVKVSQFETRPTNTFVNYLIKYTYALPSFKPIATKIPS